MLSLIVCVDERLLCSFRSDQWATELPVNFVCKSQQMKIYSLTNSVNTWRSHFIYAPDVAQLFSDHCRVSMVFRKKFRTHCFLIVYDL